MSKRRFILSDQRTNTYGFRVLTSGIDTTDFALNPVMLFDHNSSVILGKWNELEAQSSNLTGVPEFDEADADAMKYSNKVEKGYLNGASIGIIIMETSKGADGVMEVTKCLLKEVSLTAIPANGNCIAVYSADGARMNDQQIAKLFSTKTNPIMNKIQLSATMLVALALQTGASDEQIELAITNLVNENKQMKQKLDQLNQEAEAQRKAKVKALIDGAISAKKITEADRADWTTLADANYDAAEKRINALPVIGKLNTEIEKKGGPADRSAWTFLDWSKKDSAGLLKLKQENPDEYKRLYDEQYPVKMKMNG